MTSDTGIPPVDVANQKDAVESRSSEEQDVEHNAERAAERLQAAALLTKAEQVTNVTRARLLVCLESAQYWADELPVYAAREKRIGNRLAIVSGALAALTGLTVWPLVTEQYPPLITAGVVSVIAFSSAILALVLKVNRYTEMAERGQELAGLYGQALGLLLDLVVPEGEIDQQQAHAAVAVFQQAKVRKDKLDRLHRGRTHGPHPRSEFRGSLERGREMVATARELQEATKSSTPGSLASHPLLRTEYQHAMRRHRDH